MDQPGELGLGVSVSVPPIFESLTGGRLGPDENVADRGMFSVGLDVIEGSRIGVLVYCDLFAFDGDGEWFLCHGFLFPFVWCCGVEEFLREFLAFFGELPSPAWSFPGADAVPVDAVGVAVSFEFDHAASQALWSVVAA